MDNHLSRTPAPPASRAAARSMTTFVWPIKKKSPPSPGVLKNAGLAYLNLIRLKPKPTSKTAENERYDDGIETLLRISGRDDDPLQAALLLPWETTVATSGTAAATTLPPNRQEAVHQHRTPGNGNSYADITSRVGEQAEAGWGGGRAGDDKRTCMMKDNESSVRALLRLLSSTARKNDAGALTTPSPFASKHSKAEIGNWRDGASTRFMEMWAGFLAHPVAPLDAQYNTIEGIYNSVVKRVQSRQQATKGKRSDVDSRGSER